MNLSTQQTFCRTMGRSEAAVSSQLAEDRAYGVHGLPLDVLSNVGAFYSDDVDAVYLTPQELGLAVLAATTVRTRWSRVWASVDAERLWEDAATVSGSWVDIERAETVNLVRYYTGVSYETAASYLLGAVAYEAARWRLNEGDEMRDALQAASETVLESVVLPTPEHVVASRGADRDLAVMRQSRHHLNDLKEQIQVQRFMVVCLKAYFYQWMLEAVQGVDAGETNELSEYRQWEVKTESANLGLLRRLMRRWAVVFSHIEWLAAGFVDSCSWLFERSGVVMVKAVKRATVQPSLLQLYLEVFAFCALLFVFSWTLSVYFCPPAKVLTKPAAEKRTTFLGKERTSTGTVYKFMQNGELVLVPEMAPQEPVTVEEMALPGSDLFPSKKQELGAILVATEETELAIVGCFWRYGDNLVTAQHVANAVATGIADVYIAGLEVGQRGVCRVNMRKAMKVDAKIFEMDSNVCVAEADVHVAPLTPSQWSGVRVGKASVGKASHYGMTVSAVGFVNGCLMTSAGRTLPDSGAQQLWHTASTQKGFSGAPLYCGKSVVGMHVSAAGNKNVAIRTELIEYFTPNSGDESNMPDIYDNTTDLKYLGESARWEDLGNEEYVVERRGGRVHFCEREELEELFPALRKNGKLTFGEFEADEETERKGLVFGPNDPKKRWADYDDEGDKPDVYVVAREAAVHCSSSPKEQAVASAWLDANAEKLEILGYDKTKYVYPDIDPKLESDSCKNHLKLFAERNRTITETPTKVEKTRAVYTVLQLMKHNKFEPKSNYKSRENLTRIIDSSAVKDRKSPGHPYQGMGLPLNKDVLAHFTTPGFVEVIGKEWKEPFDVKVFIKSEPTKKQKIDKGMARVITGLPLHKMVKHQAVFEDMLHQGVENWMQSPVVGGYAPQVAGHIENLVRRFTGKAVYESDKTNWDYMYYEYLFEMLEDVLIGLAVRDDSWSDEGWEGYLEDIRGSVREVSHQTRYRCTNGDVYQSKYNGAMDSGWLLTFFANSVGQLLLHALISQRVGITVEQMLEPEYAILAGGDDVLQTFPAGFNQGAYIKAAAALGCELSEFVVHEGFDGCEFFSSKLYKKQGFWQFVPLRFTKHIAALRTQKVDDLAGALASHMLNYVWDTPRFKILQRMFTELRKEHPALFPLSFAKTQFELQMKVKGCEMDC